MNSAFIRGVVKGLYPGEIWKNRVDRMKDDQVIAIWLHYLRHGVKPPEPKTDEPESQLRLF